MAGSVPDVASRHGLLGGLRRLLERRLDRDGGRLATEDVALVMGFTAVAVLNATDAVPRRASLRRALVG